MNQEKKEPQGAESETVKNSGQGVILSKLAELPPKTLLDEKALAQSLGVCGRTIRRMATRFEIPPGIVFAGRKLWQAGKVLEYFETKANRAIKEAERQARKIENYT